MSEQDQSIDEQTQEVVHAAATAEVLTLSRKTALRLGAIIGIALALTIAGVVWVALMVNNIQDDRIADNERINEQQSKVINDLRQLTNPTKEEYEAQLRIGIQRCLASEQCRQLFPGVKDVPHARGASDRGGDPQGTDRSPSAFSPTAPDSSPTGGGFSPGGGGGGGGGGNISPGGGSPAPGGGGGGGGSPSQPRPRIDLRAPLPVQTCVDGLLGVNC